MFSCEVELNSSGFCYIFENLCTLIGWALNLVDVMFIGNSLSQYEEYNRAEKHMRHGNIEKG